MFTHNSQLSALIIAFGLSISPQPLQATEAYTWNNVIPVKVPSANTDNGKIVLFDTSHGGVEGNADWVIDGAFSDFADALVEEGYQVQEYRGIDLNNDGAIRYFDSKSTNQNEAIITYQGISHADVFVLAETNRPFTQGEQQALEQFVAAGKGIFFIADHYDADRNLNTWDATEVFNGYNRSALPKYEMSGEYGDWRNPKMANAGWLVENFGIRFRFNSIDYKQGVSGIVSPQQSEGITQGVQPILMAGGATLAIVNEQKAKGLVYFSESDTPVKWNYAKDKGLYFGGEAEGPYVAIAKSGAGKAAFIGDSSPIEDATPKYKRQDNGQNKRTYPGWTDSGNAATLSVNLINWLSTPESYQYFDNQNGHLVGIATPNAMAQEEMSDPNNGQPWGDRASGFNPNDTNSYQNNSYNAPYGDGGTTSTPMPQNSVSVTQALASAQGTLLTVRGKVSAEVNGIYGLILNDINDPTTAIYVKLESDQRTDFNPQLNPEILNQSIIVTGVRSSYMNEAGIRDVSDIQIAPSTLSVAQALATAKGEAIEFTGKVIAPLNDIYGLLLADNNDPSLTINVKLESNQREQFSPQLNPDLLDSSLTIKGTRDSYMGEAGIRQVVSIELLTDTQPSNMDLSINEVLGMENGTPVVLSGQIKGKVFGKRGIELINPENPNSHIYIKLKVAQRADFSPKINPTLIGKKLRVEGIIKPFRGHDGIKRVTKLTLLD
ncbi:hypothetical protein CW745_03530 [Psychromonas sp. psych-6C06]|nr:hypothetical protein CW745_03530 [Psychromonas sp. psych-6C06]